MELITPFITETSEYLLPNGQRIGKREFESVPGYPYETRAEKMFRIAIASHLT